MGNISPFPAGYLAVELFYSGAWVDISADVTDDGVTITRGQPNEGSSTAAPSSMTVTLMNPAGKYSPRNPRSPLYGLIGRGTPIRVIVKPAGLPPSIRYTGKVYEWPVSWGLTGSPSVTCTVICSGILRQLAQSSPPSVSPARRTISTQTGVVAYWPLEDVASARFDAAIGSDAPVGSGVQLAAVQPWEGSKSLPTLSTGRFTGTCATYTGTGQAQFRWVGRFTTAMALNTLALFTFRSGTLATIELTHTAATDWGMKAYNTSGTEVSSVSLTPFFALLINSPVNMSLELRQVGANVDVALSYLKPYEYDGGLVNWTIPGVTLGAAKGVTLNPFMQAWAGNEIGHVAIGKTIVDIFDAKAPLEGFPGESTTTRAARVLTESGTPHVLMSGGGSSPLMAAQKIEPLIDTLNSCVEAGQASIYEDTTTDKIIYRNLFSLANQAAQLVIDYTDNLVRPLDPLDDDQNTANKVTANRTAGGYYTATQTDGPLGTTAAGEYETQATVNVLTSSQLPDQANWRLARGTLDEPRWPRLGFDLAHPTFQASTPLSAAALGVDIGSRIIVNNPPAWLPPGSIDQRVLGLTETITPQNHRLEFNTDPYQLLSIGRYDNSAADRYDGHGTTLAAAVTATATTLTLATPPGVTWTSADGSYAIMCGGEKMTVTNVTGSTMTVVRGVDGFSSAHPVGRPVQLAAPVRYSL